MASTIAATLNRRSVTIDRPIAAAAARLRVAGRKNWNILATSAVILATAVHVPLLRSDVSWSGDDALQYLNHARSIALGRPYSDTGYIYSRFAAEVGPASYPAAFPLALAPIYKVAGLTSFAGYKIFGLAMLALILLLTAVWCRRIPPRTGSAAIVVILAFNPVL